MPAIQNSTTLGNIPADIDASIHEINISELIIATDNTNATDVIDTSNEALLSFSAEIPPSMSNDTASADIEVDLDIGNGMSITEAPTLYNVTDAIDGFRTGRNLDFFPNLLASITKNDPIAYIWQYKLSINTFADEMVNHLQRYGLSENLFEPLCKVGKAFEEFYGENSQKQALVKRYFQYISNLSNSSDSIPINCSDTTHWSIPTTTTPLSSIETAIPTEYVTEAHNASSSSTNTTDSPQQASASPIPDNNLNVTLEATNTTANTTSDSNQKNAPGGFLDTNKLTALAGISFLNGFISDAVRKTTGAGIIWLRSNGYLNGWREPAAKVSAIFVNSATIATLPLMLFSVENESEKNESLFEKILTPTLYSFGTCLVLEGINCTAQWGYRVLNKTPLNKDSIASKALDALPLAANVGSLFYTYKWDYATTLLASSLAGGNFLDGVITIGDRIFKSNIKNYEPDVEKNNNIELNEIDIDKQFRNILSQVYHVDNETTHNFFIKLDAYFKQQDTIGKPININEFYLRNLKQLDKEDPIKAEWAYNYLISEKRLVPVSNEFQIGSAIPLAMNKIENWDELSLINKYDRTYKNKISFPSTSVAQLERLIATFLYGFKLQTTDFQVSSTTAKNFKLLSGDLAPPIDMFTISVLGSNSLSIFQPMQIQGNSAKNFPVYEMLETLISSESEKNKASSQIFSGKLFSVCSETTIAIIEITKLNSSKPKNKIIVHDPKHLLTKDLGKIANIAKKHGYSFKNNPDKNYRDFSGPLGAYYFIKNFVKNYTENQLQINMLPNNENPKLLKGLVSAMLSGLTKKVNNLAFNEETLFLGEVTTIKRIKKSHTLENKSDKTTIEASEKTGLILEQSENQTAIISEQIKRKKEKSIAYLSSDKLTNGIISIFTTTPFKDRGDAHALSTPETISYLLSKRQSDIKGHNTPQLFKDLLPLNNKEGIAIIEIISDKNTSKQILIHDPNHILEKTVYDEIFAGSSKNYGYICKYNPNKAYSSYWNAKETSQLGAYFFIKNYFHENIGISPVTVPPKLENYFEIRKLVLDELTNNLSLVHEEELDALQEINVTDDIKFNLKSYITEINAIYQIPNNEIFLPSSNKTKPYQIILDEIKHNLDIKDNIKLSGDSNLEITLWEKAVNFEWSELFSKKCPTLNEKNSQTTRVLFYGTEPQKSNEADIVRFLVSLHSKLMVLKNEKELKESQEADQRKRLGKRHVKGLSKFFEIPKNETTETMYDLVNKFLDSNKTVILNSLGDLFLKLKSTTKDQQETEIYDEYHKLLFKTFSPTSPDQLKLFSELAVITKANQETQVYSANRSSFFSAAPSSTTVAPGPQNHLAPGYK